MTAKLSETQKFQSLTSLVTFRAKIWKYDWLGFGIHTGRQKANRCSIF